MGTVKIETVQMEKVQLEADIFCGGLLDVNPPVRTRSDRPKAGTLCDHDLCILSDDFAKARGNLVRPVGAEFSIRGENSTGKQW